MGVVHKGSLAPMTDDPDDYRPGSSWRLAVDPDGRNGMTVIYELIGAGERIPRHWHEVDEVVLIERGAARVHVDGVDIDVSDGATVFIPAGAIHGTTNVGGKPLDICAIFPTTRLRMDLVQRNPMPGTEERAPQVSIYDARSGAFDVIGPTELPAEYR